MMIRDRVNETFCSVYNRWLKNIVRPCFYPLRIWSSHFSRGNLHRWVRAHRTAVRGKVLNIGSGGEIGQYIGACTSVDIDPKRRPDIVADACDLRSVFDSDTFDAVFLIEVLEHIAEPHRAISEIHRILKPGGILILSTPYIFEMHDVPHDYWRFTEYGLKNLLKCFDPVNIEKRNGYFTASFTLLVRLLYSQYLTDRCLGLLFTLLALPLYPLIAVLDWMILSNYATTGYHVIATKPPGSSSNTGSPIARCNF